MTLAATGRRVVLAVIVLVVVGALVGVAVTGRDATSTVDTSSPGLSSPTAVSGPVLAVSSGLDLLALDVVDQIPVAEERRDGYDRASFGYPIEATGDGCDTREVVLIRDSMTPAQVDPYGCHVIAGDWYSAYDDITWTDPTEVEIDHVVALAEAHDSGAWAWTDQQRRDFANNTADPRMLRAVTAAANQTKSADDPADWLPSNDAFVCQYVSDWIGLKASWSLSMDATEHDTVRTLIVDRCPDLRVSVVEVP